RRLAAARRTHQGDELSARHIERQLAHRDGPVRVHLRYAVQADHRLSGTVIVMLLPAAHSTSVTDDCLTRNDWVCLEYLTSRRSQLLDALGEHVYITVVSLVGGTLVALALALVARRHPRLRALVQGVSTGLYTIPSLALFSLLLVPGLALWGGLSSTTVIIGLILYSLTVLVRGILAGLDGVPPDARESAIGMGYGPRRLLWRVELPLALPTIFAALRVAAVSTVALTTVGVIVGHGGLG